MSDFDRDSLLKEFVRVVRRLLAERTEPAASATKREPFVEVLDLRPDRVALEPSDGTDEHDRWFHKLDLGQ